MKQGDTKQKILDKALALFSSRGYDAVSVGEIAQAVGIKAPSLYNYFPSKQAIFDALVESVAAQYTRDTDQISIHVQNAPQDIPVSTAITEDALYEKVRQIFEYSLHNETIRRFRRMMTIEQFRSPELSRLYTERYITPELKQYEDQRISAKERASQIERALWDELVTYMHGWVEVLLAAAHAAAALDVLLGFARHAFEMRWTRPQLMSAPGIDITGARHPVVEKMIDGYIPNNCSLVPGRRLLIITGPNMGGKSTYMRSVALIVLLAYAGSFVPAAASQIGPVDKILTRIGASDDLARGRSTFMVEMTEAASILMQATEESLVLMDEIGRGTSTFDGLSLAGAIAEELAEGTRSWTLFATHYFELTQLAQKCREAVNVHVSAENTSKGIVFLHDVKDGPASQSYGIAVASLAGIPARVIRRAKALLKKLEERAKEDTGPQLDLFAAATEGADTEEDFTEEMPAVDPAVTAFVDEVAAIDIDSLSPRDAMNKLYELTEKAKSLG